MKERIEYTHLGILSLSNEEVTPDKVNTIIRSLAANNALIRLKRFLDYEEKKT